MKTPQSEWNTFEAGAILMLQQERYEDRGITDSYREALRAKRDRLALSPRPVVQTEPGARSPSKELTLAIKSNQALLLPYREDHGWYTEIKLARVNQINGYVSGLILPQSEVSLQFLTTEGHTHRTQHFTEGQVQVVTQELAELEDRGLLPTLRDDA